MLKKSCYRIRSCVCCEASFIIIIISESEINVSTFSYCLFNSTSINSDLCKYKNKSTSKGAHFVFIEISVVSWKARDTFVIFQKFQHFKNIIIGVYFCNFLWILLHKILHFLNLNTKTSAHHLSWTSIAW
jgi:hypothetical protein